jgi:nucleotidyltransferase/DNA polymerase involved in DNA repair
MPGEGVGMPETAGKTLTEDQVLLIAKALGDRRRYEILKRLGERPDALASHIRGRMRGAPADHRKGLAHLRGTEIRGRTVTLKVKYADFQQITRSRTGQALFSARAEIEQLSYALLEPLFPVTKGIRLLGMTLSSLGEKQLESEPQLRLSI